MTDRPEDFDRPDPLGEGDLTIAPLHVAADMDGTLSEPVAGGMQTSPPPEDQLNLGGNGAEGSESPSGTADDEIEATRVQIEQTRAEMSETIDAIQEKLSPENLKEQAKETVKQATVGKVEEAVGAASDKASQTVSSASETFAGAGSSGAQRVKQNLIPLASAAAGVAGLLVGRRVMQARRERAAQVLEAQRSRSDAATQTLAQAQQKAKVVAGNVGRRAGQIGKRPVHRTGRAGSPREVAAQLRDRVGQVQGRVGQVQGSVGRMASRGTAALPQPIRPKRRQTGLSLLFEETPVTVIDLMAALAVAIALAILRRARRSGWL